MRTFMYESKYEIHAGYMLMSKLATLFNLQDHTSFAASSQRSGSFDECDVINLTK